MQNSKDKLLLVLTALTIVGEKASIILWTTDCPLSGEPTARFILAVYYTIAVSNAAVFIVINLVAFMLIF
jgi:hypothetical protein